MLMLLSPAKSLDYETPPHIATHTQPDWLNHSKKLIQRARKLAPQDVAGLMDISDALAVLNVGRFAQWHTPFTPENAKQAVLAFNGDVYEGLDAASMSATELDFAQKQVRILSGLYGLLRPLDLIQPYRLEMGTKLDNERGKDLYAFWGDSLTTALNKELSKELVGGMRQKEPVVVNLASEEYFKAIKPKQLKARLIQPVFQDWKNGQYKIISFYAKRARGLMVRYAIKNKISNPELLRSFDYDGYEFCDEVSREDTWVFRRRVAE